MNTKKIKPTRKIIIKDPRLQKIRYNFRTIIQLAVRDEWHRLHGLESLYREKRRLKKMLPSHYKRTRQLHEMKEYLTTTFSNSVCICARGGGFGFGHNNIEGDRVRYTFIGEFDECYIESLGARYEVEELWFSLKYYEENHEALEKHQKNKRKRLKECPGYITTPLELYERKLDEIRNEKRGYLEEIVRK